MNVEFDQQFMRRALELALQAQQAGEVPVGAVVVDAQGQIIGEGFNCPISCCDPSAHAEIQALRVAAQSVQNYRLPGATLYVTIEPCTMCAGALVHSRIARLVYGAAEPRAGVVDSQDRWLERPYINHRIEVTSGVLEQDCAELMREFFRSRR